MSSPLENTRRWSWWTDACWAGLAIGVATLALFAYFVQQLGWPDAHEWFIYFMPVISIVVALLSVWGLRRQYLRDPVVARSFSQLSLSEFIMLPILVAVTLATVRSFQPEASGTVIAPASFLNSR